MTRPRQRTLAVEGPLPGRGPALVRRSRSSSTSRGEHTDGIFVGLWVPSILALGAFLAPRRIAGARRDAAGEAGPMIGIFIYGRVVFALVCVALGLLAWGIVNERRDRTRFEQGREVFGDGRRAPGLATSPRGRAR